MENKENKVPKWDDIKRQIWIHNTWAKIKYGASCAGKWAVHQIVNHPVESLTVLGGAAAVTKKLCKAYSVHTENVRRELEFWDPRTGRYTRAKRKLSPKERLEIDRRYRNDRNESYVSILSDMNLMK